MRLNESVAVITNKLVFLPYEASHVETYSEWMGSEAIREATASERLSLAEEYAMQKSWREDADKLTFILSLPSDGIKAAASHDGPLKNYIVVEGVDDKPEILIGDVNLFLYEDDEEEEVEGQERGPVEMVGEVELMIARPEFQGRGLGKLAVIIFILYVLQHQGDILSQDSSRNLKGKSFKHLRVKIGKENTRSLELFQKLGFVKLTEEPNVFGEFELRLKIEPLEGVQENLEVMMRDSGVEWMEEVGFQRPLKV
ncbi:hypothetical protein H072_2942 [Dactylellina haptotyla CBS 200.50]|uniref:N-acetyltransferase domain-containing protein n=1 Tax=Dactylellina haptotyla (strain CBS 200.50) TaxID=1284197 RepID=S8APM0_DACHA|nr:hypothetical protein H072_2942 [Dactylellina haptotyla CBS 200.50]